MTIERNDTNIGVRVKVKVISPGRKSNFGNVRAVASNRYERKRLHDAVPMLLSSSRHRRRLTKEGAIAVTTVSALVFDFDLQLELLLTKDIVYV